MAGRAWIKVSDDSEATADVNQAYEKVIAARGSNFNIDAAAGLWPSLLELQKEEFALFSGSETELGPEIKDLIAALVSQLNNCDYCQTWYRDVLKLRGWSDEKITHLLQDIDSAHLDEEGRAIMVFADKMTRRPQSICPEDIDALRRAGVDDRAILETAALTGYYNYMARLSKALGAMAGSEERASRVSSPQ